MALPDSEHPAVLESRFDADYGAFVFDVLLADDAKNSHEAQYAARLGEVGQGDRVLDVPCGVGRLTTHLATLGCDVVGVDLSGSYVTQARERSRDADQSRASFVLADMTNLPFAARFDVAICWFISLGYYSEEFDRAFFVEVARCVRPGGLLVIEAVNPVGMIVTRADLRGEFIEETWVDDNLMSLRLRYDPVTGTNDVERTVVRDGVVRRHNFSVRLYSPTELDLMLGSCGFRVRRIVNHAENALGVADERMYVVGERVE